MPEEPPDMPDANEKRLLKEAAHKARILFPPAINTRPSTQLQH